MTGRTVFTKIQIEIVIFRFKSKLVHTCFQFTVVILSLASSDDLSDSRYKTVHSCYSLTIFVEFHIEGLDLFRIISNKYRSLVDLLCQITLVLCLKITAPEYLVIKFIVIFLKDLNSLCVCYMCKLGVQHMVQSVKKSLVYEGIEEIYLLRCILKNVTDHIFQHSFCKLHSILNICKCTLRLDHPELSCMTCCIGVLCTESRSECVDIAECLCKCLTVELTAYCKVSLFSEEVLRIIYFSILCHRYVLRIQCCYLEHFSCALTVTSCDQWCMHIDKISLLEEFMNRICTERTYTEYCLESVCSRS